MRKIINGHRYDTGTSRLVHTWDDGLPQDDESHFTESLYCKVTGEYFLYGQGGSKSRYAKKGGRSSMDGESVVPVDVDQAKKWAKEHMSQADYDEEFDARSDDERTKVAFYMTKSCRDKLKRMAVARDTSISTIMEALILAAPEKPGDERKEA